MRRTILKHLAVVVVVVLLLAACGGAPKVDWTLSVDGAVETPLSLSYADLVAMPQLDLTDILMQKSLGEDEIVSWSGVPLEAILAQAGASSVASITATAADGYAIEISRDELPDAIVALKKGDDWITSAEPDKGPIRLVCPEAPANRWVFQLQGLTIND